MTALAVPPASQARALLAWAEQELRATSDSARLDAELLLANSAGIARAALIAHPERFVGETETRRLVAAVARRAQGEPLAYITGRREFYSIDLAVDASVLVPRPETELLVEHALVSLPAGNSRVLDLGTGSGAIALAIKRERAACEVVGVDVCSAALAVARANAARLGLDVRFLESDWFEGLGGERFDAIVANPPYVASADPAFAHLAHEPRRALDGGPDGLDAYRAILARAPAHLGAGGVLLLEHGADQRPALIAMASAAGLAVAAVVDDLAGLPRLLVLESRS
jgi:release factor glutamine methyltransferase